MSSNSWRQILINLRPMITAGPRKPRRISSPGLDDVRRRSPCSTQPTRRTFGRMNRYTGLFVDLGRRRAWARIDARAAIVATTDSTK